MEIWLIILVIRRITGTRLCMLFMLPLPAKMEGCELVIILKLTVLIIIHPVNFPSLIIALEPLYYHLTPVVCQSI